MVQKRLITQEPKREAADWLDLAALADVELTSEDAGHPVEGALSLDSQTAWRAAEPGTQRIRFVFHAPQRLRRIHLRFDETEAERTQEFALRWSADGGRTYRDVVRQQYNFSPAGATTEVEELEVDLAGVTVLELMIIPDQRGQARASLTECSVA